MKNSDKLWGGRFESDTDPDVEDFTESVSFDHMLYREDIAGSIAHAEMLERCGLLTADELRQIKNGLKTIESEIENGDFCFEKRHEDIHMNIEAALIDIVGGPALKLHTARSRNDQVVCDFRLWTRAQLDRVVDLLASCQAALVKKAEEYQDVIVPGYTHLQRAQPVLLGHLLLAYAEMFERDRGRLADCYKRVDVSPLGACAMAGTSLPTDPKFVAERLGFSDVFRNSIDAVSDRDFILEFVSALAIVASHMSRVAEDWLLWSSNEFNFLDQEETFCTGSSIMPQKKNPDVLELIRGKTGRVYGDLMALLTLLKAQPLAYNRDLQEDKRPVFDAVAEVSRSLAVFASLIGKVDFKAENTGKVCEDGYMDATSFAEYLVGKGLPFREAHRVVGRIVRRAAARDIKLYELSLVELQEHCDAIGEDVYEALGARNCVKRYRSHGSSSPEELSSQIAWWKERLMQARDVGS